MYCIYDITDIGDIPDNDLEYCRLLMTEDRRLRVERLRSANSRKLTIAGELLARKMIAMQCGVDEKRISFERTDKGKPFSPDLPVEFSISHSRSYVLCALSDKPVGADIEKIRPVDDRLIQMVCTEEESRFVSAQEIPPDEKMKRFFRVWTGKEAYFKFCGTGITKLHAVNIFDDSISPKLTFFYFRDYAVSIYSDDVPVPLQ